MTFLKYLLGFLGFESRKAPASVLPPNATSPVAIAPAETVRKPIRLPSKFDDMLDFGLSQHSVNNRWSVGFRDPGPDASQKRESIVRLRDNTTGRIVAAVSNLERPFSVDVSDTGVFGVNDAGQATELSSNLVIFDTTGRPIYRRRYKANLFGFSISPCGRYVASQTCNSPNEDSSILEMHDIAHRRVLASCTPVAGWSSTYTFETEDGELKRVFATINHLGKFAYSPTGEFLDTKKFMTTRLTKGDPWTRIRAAGELVRADGSDEVLERAIGVVSSTISAFQPGQDDRWLAEGYRLKGELLEKTQRLAEAMEAYRTALGINAKVGVKKKLANLEKIVSHQTRSETGAGRSRNNSPRSD